MDIPKVFWKFYDLYRRGLISLEDFSEHANLSTEFIEECLGEISV